MKFWQMTLFSSLLFLFFFLIYLIGENKKLQQANNDLNIGKPYRNSGVGVAIANMDKDGDSDIISASTKGIKYFENKGDGTFVDHGVIRESNAGLLIAGVGIAVGDIDGNGILDIIAASPDGIKIFKNPIPPKNN